MCDPRRLRLWAKPRNGSGSYLSWRPLFRRCAGKILLTDPAYPFRYLQTFCRESDLFFVNLETPISTQGEVYVEKTFTFRCSPQVVKTLKAGNINVVSLANNHIMDYGPEALAETITLLEQHNIAYTGAGPNLAAARTPALLEKNGIKVAFLAYNNTFPLEFNATATPGGHCPR